MLHRGGGDVHAAVAVDEVVLCTAVELVGDHLHRKELLAGEVHEGMGEQSHLHLAGQIPLQFSCI